MERERVEREHEQDLAVARGAARITRTHFDQARTVIGMAVQRREWWPKETPFQPRPRRSKIGS
jgi:hypothetical protein